MVRLTFQFIKHYAYYYSWSLKTRREQEEYLAHSMNARKCVHAQKPYPSQAFTHESSKIGGREKERERDRKDKARRLMERKAAQQNKNTYEKQKHE